MSQPSTADEWADQFGRLRGSGPGAAAAWLGIPLAVASLLGLLWAAPVPAVLAGISPALNLATLFVMAAFVYYCILSLPLAAGALLFLIGAAVPAAWLDSTGRPLALFASVGFAVAFAWQLTESRRATGRLLILRNLQYVMLGPLWLIRALYRRAGLKY